MTIKEFLFSRFVEIRKFMYVALAYIDSLFKRENPLTVLVYHSIGNDNWRFSITKTEFKKQIRYLKKRYRVISYDDFDKYMRGKLCLSKPSILITFDDGYKDVLTVKDLLSKEKIYPLIFILGDPNNAVRAELETDLPLLTYRQIITLKKTGWEIGSHGSTHLSFNELDRSKIKSEIYGSKQKIEKNISTKVKVFTYPKGKYDQKIVGEVEKAGYIYAFSMDDGILDETINKYTIPRVGIDRTHSFNEFKASFSPSVIFARSIVKKILRYLKIYGKVN